MKRINYLHVIGPETLQSCLMQLSLPQLLPIAAVTSLVTSRVTSRVYGEFMSVIFGSKTTFAIR